jgi:hypothetical protein
MSLLIIKLTPIEAVVKVYGAGATTINQSTNLNLASETVSTPIVDIVGIWYSVIDATGNTIVRGTDTLWNFPTGAQQFQFDTWADTLDRSSNITVNIGAGGGTVVLKLTKKGGYGDSSYNPNI